MVHATLGQQRHRYQQGRQCQLNYAFGESIRDHGLISVFYLTTTLTQLVDSLHMPNVTYVPSSLWMRRSREMDAISEPFVAHAAASANKTLPAGQSYTEAGTIRRRLWRRKLQFGLGGENERELDGPGGRP
jgi:hypothetical protein